MQKVKRVCFILKLDHITNTNRFSQSKVKVRKIKNSLICIHKLNRHLRTNLLKRKKPVALSKTLQSSSGESVSFWCKQPTEAACL